MKIKVSYDFELSAEDIALIGKHYYGDKRISAREIAKLCKSLADGDLESILFEARKEEEKEREKD